MANKREPVHSQACRTAPLRLYRQGQATPVLSRVWSAHRAGQRLRGLLDRAPLQVGEGLLLSPCNSIHTVGMTYPLDVVFVDRQGRVVKCVAGLKPWRTAAAWRARHTLELAAGSLEHIGLKVGDSLRWSKSTQRP